MADLLTSIRAEIDARLRELAPAIAEYEQLSTAVDALGAEGNVAQRPVPRSAARPATRAVSESDAPVRPSAKTRARPKVARRARRERAVQSPTEQAILAALEHGSHTVAELVLVTALPAGEIRDSLRHLRKRKAIVKTDRDGRSAYALPAPAA
ncbi:MAG: hypothetical protein WB709_02970 [Solirubrobacteraceae bacterium]